MQHLPHNGLVGRSSRDAPARADDTHYWTMWENKLQTIYHGERIIFLCVFCFVTFVAIIGNLLTLYVVVTRKQRLLFKACLLSLALSDLIYASSCGANYISKLFFDTSALWYLGRYGCTLIPFLQTSSLLSGSMSLVSIALDRYMAVFNRRKSQWQPSALFCFAGISLIWSISAGISSPMLFSYEIVPIIVVPEIQENFYSAEFCLISNDDKDETLYYYCIIFIFVFLPLFVTFVSFNGIIAREIYRRRKAPGSHARKRSKRHTNEDSSSSALEDGKTSNDTNSTSVRNNTGSRDAIADASPSPPQQQPTQQIFVISQVPNNDRSNERQRRQMRMFKVILVLMCVFIMFRLPTWVFLLIKLNYVVEPRTQWLINYSLSVVGIMNSMANPFLYTFLSETIRFSSYVRSACSKLCRVCSRSRTPGNYASNAAMFAKSGVGNDKRAGGGGGADNGGVYLGN